MSEIRNIENFAQSYKDLNVYQKAYAFSLEVHKASLTFPQIEQFALADQIRRASKSICANIAEGFGKQRASKAEFRRFLMMAIGSCDEMAVWIQYVIDLEYVNSSVGQRWQGDYNHTVRMLQTLFQNSDNR
jgi:four helix bundle protein